MTENMVVKPGSVVSVSNLLTTGRWLGLVVDQEAGKKWAGRDPCIESPIAEKFMPILVRVLGRKFTEGGRALGRSSIPTKEPGEEEIIRWVYVPTAPRPHFYVVAGPDAGSVKDFLESYETLHALGMRFSPEGGAFYHDLKLVMEYLRRDKKAEEETTVYDRKFFKMLEEVLPR